MYIKKIILVIIFIIIVIINKVNWYENDKLLNFYKQDLENITDNFFKNWCDKIKYETDEKRSNIYSRREIWSYYFYFWVYLFEDKNDKFIRCLMIRELIRKNIQDIINLNLIKKI